MDAIADATKKSILRSAFLRIVACYYLSLITNLLVCLTEEVNVSTISPIGPDELPPPYQQAGLPMVTCRVCQAMIDISGKREQHVVKCSDCNEATVRSLLNT